MIEFSKRFDDLLQNDDFLSKMLKKSQKIRANRVKITHNVTTNNFKKHQTITNNIIY